MPPPAPRWILALTLVASLALVATAPMVAWSSASVSLWHRFGFQLLIALTGVIGVLTGVGRFRSAPAWALLCVGWTAAVAATLSLITRGFAQGARFTPTGMVTRAQNDPLVALQILAGVVILALAAATLMARRPRVALRRFGLGVALLAPVIVGAALSFSAPVRSAFLGLHPIVIAVLALVAFLVAIALVSAGGHFLIRALESGVEDLGSDDD